jgi:hypothetical protein
MDAALSGLGLSCRRPSSFLETTVVVRRVHTLAKGSVFAGDRYALH